MIVFVLASHKLHGKIQTWLFHLPSPRNSRRVCDHIGIQTLIYQKPLATWPEKLSRKWKLASNVHLNNRAMDRCAKATRITKTPPREQKNTTFGLNGLI